MVACGLVDCESQFANSILFLNRHGFTRESSWYSKGGRIEDLVSPEDVELHDVLWRAVHDYARSLCPNLSSAYTFGKAAAEWFPLRQPHGIPIIWKCCHPEYIMRGGDDSNLMKFSKGLEVMAAAAQSFHSKSFSPSLMADDALLGPLGIRTGTGW